MKRVLISGSSGLIGSEVATYFDRKGWSVVGIDNNMRRDFFGKDGDTRWIQRRLEATCRNFEHRELDIRDRHHVLRLAEEVQPDLVVHAAAQPSHDLAARRPLDDFDVNAVGTLNLLEAVRLHAEDAVFVHMSTNKVYGDRPNQLELVELDTRWDYAEPDCHDGIDESMSVDQCLHSVFGASKAAADIMVQEYGRYYGLRTCCMRGGCLTGPAHSGVELHGFLSYLVRCNVEERQYTVFGYKGKQVRDNIHAFDVARAIEYFYRKPSTGAVFNLGGGRANSVSILEAFDMVAKLTGLPMRSRHVGEPRRGDHVCYISNLSHIKRSLPGWDITRSIDSILREIVEARRTRLSPNSGSEHD